MFDRKGYSLTASIIVIGFLSGCGLYVPALSEIYDGQDTQTMVNAVVEHVQCEVQTSVQFLLLDDIDAAAAASAAGLQQGRSVDWLNKWGAQAILTITVDEKGSLNPGVTFTPPMAPAVTQFAHNITVTTPQSFSLGLGGSASADATRKETLSWLIDFKRFTDKASLAKARALRDQIYELAAASGTEPVAMLCNQQHGTLVQGDLKLKEWLYAATTPTFVRGGAVPDYAKSLQAEAKASKKDVIAHEITFVILYSGNVTPSWKLLRVSANTGSLPLLGTQRSRTQDLIISMGPTTEAGPSQAQQNAALASQIGIAVANAIKGNN
ncbi:hypothetical protein ACFLEY_02245 [Bradyrhizobium sp. YCK136]|uniref:hypothetical protein n=1 Tax=Bradyrhizobium sp. YCK136 TaxID=3351346 RepID=UPI0037C8657E